MSEARDILGHIVSDRQSYTGDTVRNLMTGTRFTAELEEIQDTELNTELGRDARETVLFHVSDRIAAAEIVINTQLEAIGQRFKVLRRKDNPAGVQVEYGCMKITDKDS